MMQIQVDREKDEPLYKQIAEQLKSQIIEGQLPKGARLPTIRQLAEELDVTKLTIQSAYAELQAEGWIDSTVGRGTFVSEAVQAPEMIATVGQEMTPDGVLGDMTRLKQIVGVRSLAYAEPDPEFFPMDDFWNSLNVLREQSGSVMLYSPTQGEPALRIEITKLLAERDIEATPDNVFITCGVMQGLSLVSQALARPGDKVVVERPTYLGLLHILKAQGLEPFDVPMDSEGPRLDILEYIIQKERPRFFYTISNFHNPTGISMSEGRRHDLLALAAKYRLTLVEDDSYGPLAYDSPPPHSLKAQDRLGLVIYLGGFSKCFMPGLRLGYVVAGQDVYQQMMSLRQASDLCSPTFVQLAMADFLHRGRLKVHLRQTIPHYRKRRDTLIEAMSLYFPNYVHWTKPDGGFCSWVSMPQESVPENLYHMALEHGVAYTPGEAFLTDGTSSLDGNKYLRVCFGCQKPEALHESMMILGDLMKLGPSKNTRKVPRVQELPPMV